MRTRKSTGGILLVTAVTVLTVGVGATPALASTWTVSPGGNFGTHSATAFLKDTTSLMTMTCTNSVLKGSLRPGTGPANHLGKIIAATFLSCTVGATTFTVTPSDYPWWFTPASFANPVTTGHIAGIHLALSGSNGCTAVVDGTTATANDGKVKVQFSNTSRALTVLSAGGNLHIYSPSASCAGMFAAGDAVPYTATYPVIPNQAIKSP